MNKHKRTPLQAYDFQELENLIELRTRFATEPDLLSVINALILEETKKLLAEHPNPDLFDEED